MIKSIGKFTLASLLAAIVMGVPIKASAQDAPKEKAPPTAKAKSLPFSGKVNAVDKTAKTFTVETKNTKQAYEVTSETKFYKQDKGAESPATLEDGVVGQEVTGSYKKDGDKRTASTVYWGGKAAKAPKKPAAPATPDAPK